MRHFIIVLSSLVILSACAKGQYDNAPIKLPPPSMTVQQNKISQSVSLAPPRPGVQFTNGARAESAIVRYRTGTVITPTTASASATASAGEGGES